MFSSRLVLFPFLACITLGCATNAATGVLAGATVGVGTGALGAGSQGAWIGGIVGALSGGLIGYVLDSQDRKVMEESSPRTVDRMDRGDPLTISDVIKLSQEGVAGTSIIRYLQETKSVYNLTQTQIRRMRDSGVSRAVIDFMIDSGEALN